MRTTKRVLPFLISIVFVSCAGNEKTASPFPAEQEMIGKTLFQSQCASCHSIHRSLVGPALKDAASHFKSREVLYNYIHNPAAYIDTAGDQHIKDLHKEFGLVMPSFPALTPADIDSIFLYIETEGQPVSK